MGGGGAWLRKLAVLFVPKAPEFNCAPVRAKSTQSVPCIVIKLVRALAKHFVLLNGTPGTFVWSPVPLKQNKGKKGNKRLQTACLVLPKHEWKFN